MALGENRWGKSDVRVSKVLRGEHGDDFLDVTVQVLLSGDVGSAHTSGDNSRVVPTDTMRNTVYGIAQTDLGRDLERFGETLCAHFLDREGIDEVEITIAESLWSRKTSTGFIGGGSERRTARVVRGGDAVTKAGVEGLVVLKTTGSAFEGFPKDDFTILPEASDRLLATSITAEWVYSRIPDDTTTTWVSAREILVDHFFADWSGSVQHQGYLMGEALLGGVSEIDQVSFRLPNQHHLPFDLTRFGLEWDNTVFHPVVEPFGDIYLTVRRD